jgi:hypothetical protein
MQKMSPSGSLCPYYYMGGELHPLKYGSFFKDRDRLCKVIKAEEDFIIDSSGKHNRRIWMDLFETSLDKEIIGEIVRHIGIIRPKILKLCLVGCSAANRHEFIRQMRRMNLDIADQVEFFSDPEEAKQWLLGIGNWNG